MSARDEILALLNKAKERRVREGEGVDVSARIIALEQALRCIDADSPQARKQTSEGVSSAASYLLRLTSGDMMNEIRDHPAAFAAMVRSVAASALGQDENGEAR